MSSEGNNIATDTYAIVLRGSGPFDVKDNRLNCFDHVRISLNSSYPSQLVVGGQ